MHLGISILYIPLKLLEEIHYLLKYETFKLKFN